MRLDVYLPELYADHLQMNNIVQNVGFYNE